jgi:hypothetical protein
MGQDILVIYLLEKLRREFSHYRTEQQEKWISICKGLSEARGSSARWGEIPSEVFPMSSGVRCLVGLHAQRVCLFSVGVWF